MADLWRGQGILYAEPLARQQPTSELKMMKAIGVCVCYYYLFIYCLFVRIICPSRHRLAQAVFAFYRCFDTPHYSRQAVRSPAHLLFRAQEKVKKKRSKRSALPLLGSGRCTHHDRVQAEPKPKRGPRARANQLHLPRCERSERALYTFGTLFHSGSAWARSHTCSTHPKKAGAVVSASEGVRWNKGVVDDRGKSRS